MLTRTPFIASAVLSIIFLGGCSTTSPKSNLLALSPEDAEFTTIASAKAYNQKKAETPTAFFVEANEGATTELLATSLKPLVPGTTIYLQSPNKLAKGGRLDVLIDKNVRDHLKSLGYMVADVKDMPASVPETKAATFKRANTEAAVIAATAPPGTTEASPELAAETVPEINKEVPAPAPLLGRLSISHTTEGNEAVVTLVLTDAVDGSALSTHEHRLTLNKALVSFATN